MDGESVFNLNDSDFRERRFFNYSWDNYLDKGYLPKMEEYIVSGPVWENESWRYIGHDSGIGENLLLEWRDGFSYLEGVEENNWRWCSSEGTLKITNNSNKNKEFTMSAYFSTGYPGYLI